MTIAADSWKTFALRTAVLGVVVFAAVRFAVARDGVPGGPARSFVTVAGTVTGVSGSARMGFAFHRRGSVTALCAPAVMVPVGSGGAFTAQVPLDDPASTCPADLFDGRDVEVRVTVDGTPIDGAFPINPVPYAHFASVAGELSRRPGSGWQRVGTDRYVFSVYLRNADVPACVGGFMTYNVGVPAEVDTSRDVLFSGHLDVSVRPDVPEFWSATAHYSASLFSYTHSGFNVGVTPMPTTAPHAQPPGALRLERPDANSPRLNLIVPCARMMNRLSINISAFIKRID